MIIISTPGTYGGGEYVLSAPIVGSLVFTGSAKVDLRGFTVDIGGSGNAWDYGVIMQGAGSILGDSLGGSKVTGGRVGVKLEGSGSRIKGVDLSGNRYFGAWLAADDCEVIGGIIGSIGGVSDEAYAMAVQCDHANPVVKDVRISEIYPQAGYTGASPGEGLSVNFSASCVNGTMERCVVRNNIVATHTYGVFAGHGGGHKIADNQIINFWFGIAVAKAGLPVVRGNFLSTQTALPDDMGIGCPVGQCKDNIVIGYHRPIHEQTDPTGNFFASFPENLFSQASEDPLAKGSTFIASPSETLENVDGKMARAKMSDSIQTAPTEILTRMRLIKIGFRKVNSLISRVHMRISKLLGA